MKSFIKLLLALFIVNLTGSLAFTQEDSSTIRTIETNSNMDVYKVVEEMPRFPGCESELETSRQKDKCAKEKLLDYIYANQLYPEKSRELGIEGMSVVQFIIDTSGYVCNVEIVRSINEEIDEEAIRIVRNMNTLNERWRPGHQKGKKVLVKYTLPIKFKIDNK